jgi:hypothetical protein
MIADLAPLSGRNPSVQVFSGDDTTMFLVGSWFVTV